MSSSPPLVVADRYRLVAPLGQGGMGRVWRATDVVLHRDVAIKELVPPPGLTPGERQEMRERSLREARAIARLNNINVVRVFDVLRTDADPWIVMEYVASRSLQDTLAADGPFNPVRAAEIGLGVLNALRAAHRAGVVHRDVKPGNVLLGADGRVVLTDFGLATVPGDPNVTRTGLVLGSPAYIAPERARDGTAGPAADLWSLGATLFAAVEGQSPFARPSAIATLAALATENVPPSRNAGPLKPVLNGLLRKDPAHRINAEEAERLLSRAAGRRGRVTFPMSPTMRRPGVGRERPSLPSGPGGPPVLPGSGFATGSAPVVPNPRPPVATPPPGGRTYAAGKAPVGGPAPSDVPSRAPRPVSKPLDATRIDAPPASDETKKLSGTPEAAPGTARGVHGAKPPTAPVSPARVGFTAADVAANRRKKAAPEHERSLAAATGAYPIVPTPVDSAQATTVMPSAAGSTATAPAEAGSKAAEAGSKPAEVDSKAAEAGSKAAEVDSKAPEVDSKAPEVDSKAPEVGSKAAEVDSKAPEAGSKPAEVDSKAAEAGSKASQAGSKAPEVESKPAEAGSKAAEAEGKPAEAGSKPAEAEAGDRAAGDRAAETEGRAATSAPAEPEPAQDGQPETAADEDTSSESAAASPEASKAERAAASETAEKADETPADSDGSAGAESSTAADQREKDAGEPADADEVKAADEPAATGRAAEQAAASEDADKTSFVDVTAVVPASAPAAEDATRVVGDYPASVPQFSRPSRPAWTPMPQRTPGRRTGITVLGTTLTRRQAAVGLGVLLTFVLLVGVILVQAFGDGGAREADSGKPAAATTGEPGDAKPSGGASQPGTPSASSSPTGGVPKGWHTYKGRGFSFPVPDSVKSSGGGTGTMLEWKNRLVRVDIMDGPLKDPVEFLEEQETGHYNNYDEIGITELDYHGPAADWEFYYTTGSGFDQRVVRRAFELDGKTWLLSWYTGKDDWNSAKKDFEVILREFRAG